jgi:periplasmic divalent cation tolerance protein
MDRAVMLYTTFPSLVEAEKAGKALVEDRLAACINILPGMISHYRWQGAVERGEEAVMLIKTRASLAEGARAAVKASHPYDTPAILVLPIESVDETYLAWIMDSTNPVECRPRGDEIPLSTRSRPKKVRRMNGRQRRRSRRFM